MSPDVVTFGETMVLLVAEQPGPLREATTFRRSIGGAESNVAIGVRRLEHAITTTDSKKMKSVTPKPALRPDCVFSCRTSWLVRISAGSSTQQAWPQAGETMLTPRQTAIHVTTRNNDDREKVQPRTARRSGSGARRKSTLKALNPQSPGWPR